MKEFQKKHNIGKSDVSEQEGSLLGFNDRHVLDMAKDPRANRGYDELMEMSEKIIEDYYSQPPPLEDYVPTKDLKAD